MGRPRILLVPQLTEVEWRITPLLEEWADVATYDVPGVGVEPGGPPTRDAIAQRGLEELHRRGWDRAVLVADEFGVANAVAIAALRPEAVPALALGHPCLSFDTEGERAAVDSGCMAAMSQLAATDFRTFARHLTQVTQGAYDDATADEFLRRVPTEFAGAILADEAGAVRETLEALGVPMLFAEHRDCMMFTREGFEDAVALFPHAKVIATSEKPSASPAFAEALRELCESLEQPVGSLRGDAQPPG